MMNAKEGGLEPFVGKPRLDTAQLFPAERFPNVVVSTDGTVVATWGKEAYWVRCSDDGGESWKPAVQVAEPGFHGGGTTVDEGNDSILVFNETEHPPGEPQKTIGPLEVFRSDDHGESWRRIDVVIRPDEHGNVPSRHMCEHGITLRHGRHAGRLLRPARVYNRSADPAQSYTSAVYSDDGGESWSGVEIDQALPDGPRYRGAETRGSNFNKHFGMMAGLTRLPVTGCDILLYSNADTAGHERVRGTVWASFDGGGTWPVKRVVQEGPFAYSSLEAGRPETPSAGWIYLLYEGGRESCYEGGFIARFNLAWVLQGEMTGDGTLPPPYASMASTRRES